MDKQANVRVSVSNRTIIRIVVITVITYALIKVFIKVDKILELIFLALFLSIALNPAVSWLSRNLRLKSRLIATGIAYLIVIIILGLFTLIVVPPFVRETVNFTKELPSTVESINNANSPAANFINKYHLQKGVKDLSEYISAHTYKLSGSVITTATKVGSAIAATLTVLVLTFMMLVEGPIWFEHYWRLRIVADKTEKRHQEIASKMYRIITGYVNGQVLLAVIGGAFTLLTLFIATTILNVSINEFALAGIVVLTGLIPLIGHFIGGTIVVIACLFVSLPLAIIMAVIFIVYQQIENVTFQPYIQAKYNELTPLLVFVAALIGVGVGGLVGAFVAIPLAGCLRVALREFAIERKWFVSD